MTVIKYNNKTTCDSAFNKFLKCFPNACIKVEKGQDKRHKITPSIYIVNETHIICVRTGCEEVNEKWNEAVLKAVKTFATKKSTIIWTECGKLTWTTKEKIINGL